MAELVGKNLVAQMVLMGDWWVDDLDERLENNPVEVKATVKAA